MFKIRKTRQKPYKKEYAMVSQEYKIIKGKSHCSVF